MSHMLSQLHMKRDSSPNRWSTGHPPLVAAGLQHTATHIATRCSTLHHTATHTATGTATQETEIEIAGKPGILHWMPRIWYL